MDLAVLGAVSQFLLVVLLANDGPAYRAIRVDPMEAGIFQSGNEPAIELGYSCPPERSPLTLPRRHTLR
jgi:hypothetical protein